MNKFFVLKTKSPLSLVLFSSFFDKLNCGINSYLSELILSKFSYAVILASIDRSSDTAFATSNGTSIYQIKDCSVGSASIDFDIDGIAQIAWSGQGKEISEIASLDVAANSAFTTSGITNDGYVYEGITDTDNFIRNKLTSLACTYSSAGTDGVTAGSELASNITYALTITGGNITIENNLSYLTPESLGEVNKPLGHVMGTRSISGNFTCYLNQE